MWDVHAHVIPPEIIDAARSGLYGLCLDGDWLTVGDERVFVRHMADPQKVVQYAETFGLSLVLSPPPALIRDQGGIHAEWCTFINNAMTRLRHDLAITTGILAVLPLVSPDLALKEWHRVKDTALGLTMGSSIDGRLLVERDFTPFWSGYAQSGGGLVFIHGSASHDTRLASYYLDNLVGFPTEDTIAAASLVLSGIPVNYPEIQWCISHGGGSAPFLLGRWQRGYDTQRPGIDITRPSPGEIFQHLWFDSVVHDVRALSFLSAMAPGRVVFGTDYPFPMGTQHQLQTGLLPPKIIHELETNTDNLIKKVTKGRTLS